MLRVFYSLGPQSRSMLHVVWLLAAVGLLRIGSCQPEPCISTIAGNGGTAASALSPPTYAVLSSLAGPIVMTADADSNTLFVADFNRYAIRRIDLTTGLMSHVAGTGASCQSSSPLVGPATSTFICSVADLHFDGAANLLLWSDTYSHTVRALDFTSNR